MVTQDWGKKNYMSHTMFNWVLSKVQIRIKAHKQRKNMLITLAMSDDRYVWELSFVCNFQNKERKQRKCMNT